MTDEPKSIERRLADLEKTQAEVMARFEAHRGVTVKLLGALATRTGFGRAYITALHAWFDGATVHHDGKMHPAALDAYLDQFNVEVQRVIFDIDQALPPDQQTHKPEAPAKAPKAEGPPQSSPEPRPPPLRW